MKGIILVGGLGICLYLVIKVIFKQLLFIYDKFMIYYLFLMFMLLGIKDILIIFMLCDLNSFKVLFGDGLEFGIYIEYVIQ